MGWFGRKPSNASQDLESLPVNGSSLPAMPKCNFDSTMDSMVAVVRMETEVDCPADTLYQLFSEPSRHVGIFDSIEGASFKLLEERGPYRKYELDYLARWKFWRVGGVCENKLYMETDADKGTVSFKLREPGFLKTYEGTWAITPHGQAALNLYSARNLVTPMKRPGVDQVKDVASPGGSPRAAPWRGLFAGLSRAVQQAGGVGGGSGGVGHAGLGAFTAAMNNPFLQAGSHIRRIQSNCSITSFPVSPSASPRTSLDLSHIDTPSTPSAASSSSGPCNTSSAYSSTTSPSSTSSLSESSSDQELEAVQYPNKSVVRVLEMRMCPKICPPYPLRSLLKGHAQTQVEDMLRGLLDAASRLQPEELATLRGAYKSRPASQATLETSPLDHQVTPSSSSLSLVPSSSSASSSTLQSSSTGSLTDDVPYCTSVARQIRDQCKVIPSVVRKLSAGACRHKDEGVTFHGVAGVRSGAVRAQGGEIRQRSGGGWFDDLGSFLLYGRTASQDNVVNAGNATAISPSLHVLMAPEKAHHISHNNSASHSMHGSTTSPYKSVCGSLSASPVQSPTIIPGVRAVSAGGYPQRRIMSSYAVMISDAEDDE